MFLLVEISLWQRLLLGLYVCFCGWFNPINSIYSIEIWVVYLFTHTEKLREAKVVIDLIISKFPFIYTSRIVERIYFYDLILVLSIYSIKIGEIYSFICIQKLTEI